MADNGFSSTVVHHLTAQLLEAQHRNARLQAENREVRHMLQLAGGANAAALGAAAMSGSRHAPESRDGGAGGYAGGDGAASAGAGGGGGGSGSASVSGGSEGGNTVDGLLRRMHSLLDDQARHAMLRKESGMSCMSHQDVKVVVDRCTTQLAMLDTLQARRRRDMGKRVDTADQAAVKALAEQLQALKDENAQLKEQVSSLRSESARLTTEAEETKFLRQEKADLEGAHQESVRGLQAQVTELTQDKASLQKQLRAAEARCMRLQNQVDDMQHIREEKNEIERAYLAQLEHFARLKNGDKGGSSNTAPAERVSS